MEVNETTTEMDRKEFDEIDLILPTLWKEGLLTDIDCRIISSSNKLMEKKGAVYTVIMSKGKEEAAILTEIFRNMTLTMHDQENIMNLHDAISCEVKNEIVLPLKNPFLNNMIIKNLFQFLPLKDMKRFRLVCREWNSTAEISLRKRSAIHFRHNVLLPDTFIEVSKYSHPELPFTSYAFSSNKDSSWQISDIQDFLEKWEKNIKEVIFNSITLTSKCDITNTDDLIRHHDVTDLFPNPSNITSMKIKCPDFDDETKTTLDISLNTFVSLKNLSLIESRIIVSGENPNTCIAPLNVDFQNVCFVHDGDIPIRFCYNDFVDFSKAVNINLDTGAFIDDHAVFDMGKYVFNLDQLHLLNASLENWAYAEGDIQFLRLVETPFVEKNKLKIRKLSFCDSKIDLTTLPQTLENFEMSECTEIIFNRPFCLPNLKFLSMDVEDNHSLAYFSHCALEELVLHSRAASGPSTFSLGCVPKSVVRIKMQCLQIEFADNCIFELDTLILEGSEGGSCLTDCKVITSQIKAKILVVVCNENIDTSDIVKLVLANKQSQQIIIGSNDDLHKKIPFEGSSLSKCVDKKSNYYQFENKFGKSMTKGEFERYLKLDGSFPDYFFESK